MELLFVLADHDFIMQLRHKRSGMDLIRRLDREKVMKFVPGC